MPEVGTSFYKYPEGTNLTSLAIYTSSFRIFPRYPLKGTS